MNKSSALFWTGMAMVGGGTALASPVDETIVTAGTGGLGAVLAPVQGAAGLAVGTGGVALGLGLIALSVYLEEK